MNKFCKVILKMALALWVITVVLLIAAAVILMTAPELIWQFIRYLIIIACLAAGTYLGIQLIGMLCSGNHKK